MKSTRGQELRLVLPRDEIYLKDDKGEETEVWGGLDDWAARHGISALLAPSEESVTASTLLRVISPVATQTVNGLVGIRGRAASEDFVRYAVQQLKSLCPSMGKVRIAEMLARAGLHLGSTTVGRIVKEPPAAPPPVSEIPETDERLVTAKRPNHVWNVDLTTVPIAG